MTRISVYKELTKNIKIDKKSFVVLIVLKIWVLLFGLIPPVLYAFYINNVLVDRHLNKLVLVIIGYIFVFIFQTVGIAYQKKMENKFINIYDFKMKKKLLHNYAYQHTNRFSTGDIKARIEDDTIVVNRFFNKHVLDYYYAFAYAVTLGIILLYLNWLLAIICVILFPITLYIVTFLGKRNKKHEETFRTLTVSYEIYLHNTFQNLKDIKSNNLESIQVEELNKHLKMIRKFSFAKQLIAHLVTSLSFFQRTFINQIFIYFFSGIFVIYGYYEIGTMLIFINYFGQFYSYLLSISNSMFDLKTDSVHIQKVTELLNMEIDRKSPIFLNNNIKVKNLSFCYENADSFALNNISFSLKNGEHLAIVGESGSGKTTLARLLTCQLKPQKGIIMIGDVDITQIGSIDISEKISIVSQESFFFNMTIKDNFRIVKPNATDEELINCCIQASIYDFISLLPEKFNTVIGENGVKLSGGQKQRLSIARAFLKNSNMIIFDECTSALDSEKESDIITEMKNLSKNKTMISIAHRLSSIQHCDKIIVLKEGNIVAEGTHEKLKRENEYYKFLFEKQYQVNN